MIDYDRPGKPTLKISENRYSSVSMRYTTAKKSHSPRCSLSARYFAQGIAKLLSGAITFFPGQLPHFFVNKDISFDNQ